ncbi:MAG TPA: hypothetical protein VGN48_07545 [Pedococcus sp.]|nr:hypothetical protein [Pedococcus sp.]
MLAVVVLSAAIGQAVLSSSAGATLPAPQLGSIVGGRYLVQTAAGATSTSSDQTIYDAGACGGASLENYAYAPHGDTLAVAAGCGSTAILTGPNAASLTALLPSDTATQTDPSWSPDGTQIVFVRKSASAAALYTVKADGTAEQLLAAPPAGASYADPRYSAGGTQIVAIQQTASGQDIVTMPATGGQAPAVLATTSSTSDIGPAAFLGINNGGLFTYEHDTNGVPALVVGTATTPFVADLARGARWGTASALVDHAAWIATGTAGDEICTQPWSTSSAYALAGSPTCTTGSTVERTHLQWLPISPPAALATPTAAGNDLSVGVTYNTGPDAAQELLLVDAEPGHHLFVDSCPVANVSCTRTFALIPGTYIVSISAISDTGTSTPAAAAPVQVFPRPSATWSRPTATSVRATFSTDMTFTSSSNTAPELTVTDPSGVPLSGSVVCRDVKGTVVQCVGSRLLGAPAGPIRSVTTTFVSPSVLGQRYIASVRADAADDRRGTLTDPTYSLRGSTVAQENDPSTWYAWPTQKVSCAADVACAYGGSYLTEYRSGASVTFTFTGTSVRWYTIRGPYQGIADVRIDGVNRGDVDTYGAGLQYRVPVSFAGLSSARHTVTIIATGTRAAAARATRIAVDAFAVGTTLYATPQVSATWHPVGYWRASAGRYVVSGVRGAVAAVRFVSRTVCWTSIMSPYMGFANVYVDSTSKGTVNNYSSTTRYGVTRCLSGLTDAPHTLKIVVDALKARASHGYDVAIDRYSIS